ncbi:hypothetical protein EHW97_02290 [Aeromicrobium camelliae]|uniref:Uncharacterized protein n=1 Tax=Aeromicrobium camelliae TaxID=1538144 RepID=A0A3N6X7S2_9ACTN|nr:hypothetical protein [Aeromicrobium camelliae]RQN09693.1 hypothetical protein EHW97_02290 [Aeromicrobium camelliae]
MTRAFAHLSRTEIDQVLRRSTTWIRRHDGAPQGTDDKVVLPHSDPGEGRMLKRRCRACGIRKRWREMYSWWSVPVCVPCASSIARAVR